MNKPSPCLSSLRLVLDSPLSSPPLLVLPPTLLPSLCRLRYLIYLSPRSLASRRVTRAPSPSPPLFPERLLCRLLWRPGRLHDRPQHLCANPKLLIVSTP